MKRWFAVALALALLPGSAIGQQQPPAPTPAKPEARHPGFARHSLRLTHEYAAFYSADLNGNGLEDLIVIEAQRLSRSPALFASVFLQTRQGFERAGEPQPLPPALALAGAGRFGGAPGLALLVPNAVEIWPWRDRRFRPEEAARLAVQSVFPVPATEVIPNVVWIADLNGDGEHELVVPGFDGLRVLKAGPEGRLTDLGRLAVRPRTRFWRGLTYQSVSHDIPTLFYVDLDRNGWKDVIAFSDDQLWVFPLDGLPREGEVAPLLVQDLAPPRAFDPKEPYDPPMRLVLAGDLNGDGRLDLVLAKNAPTDSDFNAKSETVVYFGRDGGGTLAPYAERPDQVYPTEGFALPILLDLNRDGLTDLIQVNVEVTFWNAMRAIVTRSVKADAAFYLMDPGERFPARPSEQESYAVNFSLSRFGHQPIASWGDFNGDGLPDLLLSAAKDQLGIRWGRPSQYWDSEPDLVITDFVPINQFRLYVLDLNRDGKDDLVLTYIRDDNRQMPETLGTVNVLLSQQQPGTR